MDSPEALVPPTSIRSMNTCKTCKWWKWFEAKQELEKKPEFTHKPCLNPKTWDDSGSLDGTYIMNSIDSFLVTGPSFGCIHHEPK